MKPNAHISNPEIRVVIIDDEPASTNLLELLLKAFSEITFIQSYNDSVAGFEALKLHSPDILFLDIEMPRLSGLDILRLVKLFEIHTHIIIITAHEKLIFKAAHYDIIDYILKPFDKERIKNSIQKYSLHKGIHNERPNFDKLFIDLNQKKIRIPTSFEELFFAPDEISYLEADGSYTHIFLSNDKKITSSFHLKKIQQLLPEDIFIRISRKHIINFSYLFKIDRKNKNCILNHQITQIILPYSKNEISKKGLLPD